MFDLVVCILMLMWGFWNGLIRLEEDLIGWIGVVEVCLVFFGVFIWVGYVCEEFWLFICNREVCGRLNGESCVLLFCVIVWMGCICSVCFGCWVLVVFCSDWVGINCVFCWFFK